MLPRFLFSHSVNSTRLIGQVRDAAERAPDATSALEKITELTAHEMSADLCSCYILRAGEVLELFALYGARKNDFPAKIQIGESLIGAVAAQMHPLKTTQDDLSDYSSFCGVPVLLSGKLYGVFTIQNKRVRDYQNQDVETLQTIAMMVAELIVSRQLIAEDELSSASGDPNLQPTQIVGASLNSGLAIGRAVLHKPHIAIHTIATENTEHELERLDKAILYLHSSLDTLSSNVQAVVSSEQADILETYRMLAADRGWIEKIRNKITHGLMTADAAVSLVQDETAARMAQISDPYLKARLHDFEDLTDRLLMHLAGYEGRTSNAEILDDAILVARSLGPADFLEYNQRKIKAILLEEGSPSSHVAIMARALGVPVIAQCKNLLKQIEHHDRLVVDGDKGIVLIRPGEDVLEFYNRRLDEIAQKTLQQQRATGIAKTLDGVTIDILVNGGLTLDLPDFEALYLSGVGLYRTEIPFMMQDQWPSAAHQEEWYKKAILQAKGKKVVFRTLDIGSDKKLSYLPAMREENPALGWRGIRITLDRPRILATQIRAILRAVGSNDLHIMFPMVADVTELRQARKILDKELSNYLAESGIQPRSIHVGVMVEVPSLLWQLPVLLKEVDFISVGSNDLLQYMYAVDRSNAQVIERFDPLSYGFLNCLSSIADECRKMNIPFSLCGEMAGRPLDALVLLGLGFRSLSMSPHAIAPVKHMIRSLNLAGFSRYLGELLAMMPGHSSYRGLLTAYARDHGIHLGIDAD